MNLLVPSKEPWADSLPGEMKAARYAGTAAFSRERLKANQRTGIPNPLPFGLYGLGQDEGDDGTTDDTVDPVIVSPTDVGPLAPGETYGPPPTGYTCPMDDSGNCTAPATQLNSIPGYTATVPGYSGPTVLSPTSATPAAPAGYEWASLLNASGNTIAKVLAVSQGGAAITLPNGQQLVYGSASSAATGAGALALASPIAGFSWGTLLIIGAGLFLFMSMSGGRK